MRTAHILGYIAKRYGGPPAVALGLGDAMENLDCSVSYWASATMDEREELAYLGDKAHLYEPRPPRSWYRCPQLARDLRSHIPNIDILHLHQVWDWPLWAASRVARKAGKPYVLSPHGIFSKEWRYKTLKKRLYLSVLGNKMLRSTFCLHAITPTEAEAIQQAGYRGPIAVVPNGISPEDFNNLPDPSEAESRWPSIAGKRIVLFLSRISPEKGLDLLIPAWKELLSGTQYDDCRLVIAGPDNRGHRALVEAMIIDRGLENSVFFTGMVVGRSKLSLMSRADVYILPSYSEGFSMSLIESLAAGIPAIVTPGCNFPQVAQSGAGVEVEPSIGAITGSLRELLDKHPGERNKMGSIGREMVFANYTWKSVAEKMLRVYECILHGHEVPMYP